MELSLVPEWLPLFTGANRSFLDCEVEGYSKLPPGALEDHWQAAATTIWFDYARLHPVKALRHFAECYARAYGDYLGSYMDSDLRYNRGLKGDVLDAREIKQFLGNKLLADRAGMPYPIWIAGHFRHFAANGWTRPPRPSHMLACDEAHESTIAYWQENLKASVQYAEDPWFGAAFWTGHPQQVRYEDFLVEQIKARANKVTALQFAIYDKGALRLERALQSFDPSDVYDALKLDERWSRDLTVQ